MWPMAGYAHPRGSRPRSQRSAPKPLTGTRLDELALTYVARFATTGAKLEAYLRRKLHERGWADEGSEPPVRAIVERCIAAGYVDDAAYARSRSHSLQRRGFGARRIDGDLGAAGVAEDLREEVRPAPSAQRRSALALARRRRLGPFGEPAMDRAMREKQIAVLLRAGHPLDIARALVNSPCVEQAEDWAGQGDEG